MLKPYLQCDSVFLRRIDLKLHSSTMGRGRPFVLVHGWGSSGETVKWLQPALADIVEAIAVDLRGFGQTGPVRGRHGVSDMAADLAELAEEKGPIIALGHSMGGSVVSHLALARPELVAGLIVIDPAYGADAEECSGLDRRRAALVSLGAAAALQDLGSAYSPDLPGDIKQAILHDVQRSDPRVLLESCDGR
jgi:pimeloyl-ACP methyl ester carboxylesterase